MNIGKHIEEILRKQGKSAAWLATQIPCERTNVYNIFKRKSLDAKLLMRISVILDYDFFKELSEEAFFVYGFSCQSFSVFGNPFCVRECKSERFLSLCLLTFD